jgi:quercetin dioxygenase-like cupin family protein
MELGKVLIFLGAILLVAGLVLLLLGRMNLPLARLPGDFLYRFSVIAFLSFRPEHFIPEGNEVRSGGTCCRRHHKDPSRFKPIQRPATIPRMKPLLLFSLAATLLAAQSTPEVEITAEPHHHLTLENKSVRVFNVEVPPNDATEMHWHRHDYIAVAIGASEISNTVKDKPPATVKFTDGDTRFASATFAHIVRDTGPAPFRNVTVEILEDATLRNSTPTWDASKNEDRFLDILPGGTKQILFVKDGIRVSEIELQPGAVIPKHHHTGPHLIIALTDLDLRSEILPSDPAPHPAPTDLHLKAGESKWIPGNLTHSVTNTGPAAKFVTLEFP